MSVESQLPAGFESLERFVPQWCIGRSCDRLQARLNSTARERADFFAAAKDIAPAALEMLDRKPSSDYTVQETRLMNLCLALAHIALAVEIQGPDEDHHAASAKYIAITRSAADR